ARARVVPGAGGVVFLPPEEKGVAMRSLTGLLTLSLAVGVVGLAGCSPKPGGTQGITGSAALNEVAGMLRDYSYTHNRGPAKAADLAQYESLDPFGSRAVKSGDVVVVWGAKMAGEGGGGSGAVIAYEKAVPTDGGSVLLDDGKVKAMTADEFKNAPKAK